jgi:hypothetical protein
VQDTLTRRHFSISMATGLAAGVAVRPRLVRAADTTEGGLTGELGRIEVGSGGRLGIAIHDTATGCRY